MLTHGYQASVAKTKQNKKTNKSTIFLQFFNSINASLLATSFVRSHKPIATRPVAVVGGGRGEQRQVGACESRDGKRRLAQRGICCEVLQFWALGRTSERATRVDVMMTCQAESGARGSSTRVDRSGGGSECEDKDLPLSMKLSGFLFLQTQGISFSLTITPAFSTYLPYCHLAFFFRPSLLIEMKSKSKEYIYNGFIM